MTVLNEHRSSADLGEREIILEIRRLGNVLRVVAVDTQTAIEISFQAPLAAPSEAIAALARRKLAFCLQRASRLAGKEPFL